jgi:hypothetical protein
MATTKVNHGLGLEFLGIVCYYLSRAAKPAKIFVFRKFMITFSVTFLVGTTSIHLVK